MPNLRSLPLCALAVAVFCISALAQSSPAPAIRILNQIDSNHLVALKGNVNPLANANNDRGAVSASLAMSGLTLVLSRSAEQQAAIDALVEDQYDPGSPSFHQWLTPAQIGERFGPAQADIDTISSWLASQGFAVKSVSPDRMTISFTGTAGQAQNSFHTAIHNLSVNGEAHIANMTDPQIPEALSSVVTGIKGLHNFVPRPLHRAGSQVQLSPNGGGYQRLQNSPAASLASGGVPVSAVAQPRSLLQPNYTYTDSQGNYIQDVAPYDFATIYNVLPLWQKSTPITGTGQTIAVLGTSDINASDVATFKSTFGLSILSPLAPIQAKGVNGTDPGVCTSTNSNAACGIGDLQENTLDVEWSGAVAPGAQVVLVTSGNTGSNDPIFDSAQYVIANVNTSGSPVFNAHIIGISYGQCELGMGTASNVAYRNLWQSAAATGIAVFVSTGDAGSAGCDQNGDFIGNPYEAQYGLAVNGIASTPFNTAVGGTDFSWCKPSYDSKGNYQGCASTNAAPYWNASNNSTNQSTAKGYIPETPWNDSCLNPIWQAFLGSVSAVVSGTTPANAEAACNYAYKNWASIYSQFGLPLMPYIDTIGGGGGASNCVVNDGTNASSCTSSTTTTGSSFGNLALINDGWPKPSWQTGVSGIPSDGVRDLPDVSFFSGDGGLNSATLVYIQGSVQEFGGTSVAVQEMAGVMALINQSSGSAQGLPNSQLYQLAAKQPCSSSSAESVTVASGCYFNDIDQGTISQPCAVSKQTIEGGAVFDNNSGQFVSGTTSAALASPNCAALNSGDLVGTLVSSGTTPGFAAGTAFDLATGLGSLNVANVVTAWTASSLIGSTPSSVTVQPASGTVESDLSLNVTVTVSGASGTPTGTVGLSAGNFSGSGTLASGAVTITIPGGAFTSAGSKPINVNYNGDSTYATSSGSSSVTVTYVNYIMGAISNGASVNRGSSTTTTANISSANGYKGTVTLTCVATNGPSTSFVPTCTPSAAATLSTSSTTASVTLTVKTTAATAMLTYPKVGDGKGWLGAGGGTVLALLVFLGIPARRRSWRAMLGLVVLIAALGSLSACTSGTTSSTATPGTASGTYTFTVTASGSPTTAPVAPQTFTVTVN